MGSGYQGSEPFKSDRTEEVFGGSGLKELWISLRKNMYRLTAEYVVGGRCQRLAIAI
jgi:hypothetical protein